MVEPTSARYYEFHWTSLDEVECHEPPGLVDKAVRDAKVLYEAASHWLGSPSHSSPVAEQAPDAGNAEYNLVQPPTAEPEDPPLTGMMGENFNGGVFVMRMETTRLPKLSPEAREAFAQAQKALAMCEKKPRAKRAACEEKASGDLATRLSKLRADAATQAPNATVNDHAKLAHERDAP